MSRPPLLHGIVAALGLAAGAWIFVAVLSPLAGAAFIARCVVTLLGLAYVAWLLGTSPARVGKPTLAAGCCAAAICTWFLVPSFLPFVGLHVAIIWLARSLLFYDSLLPALGDLLLNGAALLFAAAALERTGSVFLATWCFFLLQASFVLLAPTRGLCLSRVPDAGLPGFARARRQADAALERLETRSRARLPD